MQKKTYGVLAGVAGFHLLLLGGFAIGGGCRQPEILGPRNFEEGPLVGAEARNAAVAPTAIPSAPAVSAPAVAKPSYPALESVPVPSEPVAVSAGATYVVVAGDSLSTIAYAHKVKLSELAACNNLDPKKAIIRVGQKLRIPAGGTYDGKRVAKVRKAKSVKSGKADAKNVAAAKTGAKAADLPADGMYVVKAKDTLGKIGHKYGVSAKAIAEANNMPMTKMLQIGDKLRIPGSSAAAASVAGVAGNTAKSAEPAVVTTDETLADPFAASAAPVATPAAAPTTSAADAITGAAAPVTPVANPTPATGKSVLSNTEVLQVSRDMTLEEFCKLNGANIDEVKKLNADLPADGKLSAGKYVVVPGL